MIAEFKGDVESLRGVVDQWIGESNARVIHSVYIDVFMRHFQSLIDDPDCVLFALYNDGRPVGFIGGMLFISHLNGKLCANEQNWYVMTDHRGIGSLRLKRRLEKWAYERGAWKLLMTASALAGDDHERICKLYEKDMQYFETTYIKDLR